MGCAAGRMDDDVDVSVVVPASMLDTKTTDQTDGKTEERTCSCCSGRFDQSAFSGGQWKKGAKRRCKTCVEIAPATAVTAATTIRGRRLTTMEGKFDNETCVKMWGELNDTNDGKVTNFEELVNLWYRNLEEYVVTGTVASGELPFAVQFFSQVWLPQSSVEDIKIVRDHFCAIDETTSKLVIKEPDLLDLFVSLGHDSGRDTLKATLEKLGITDQHARVRQTAFIKPFDAFARFMSANGYTEAARPGPHGDGREAKDFRRNHRWSNPDDHRSDDDPSEDDDEEDDDDENGGYNDAALQEGIAASLAQ